MSLMALPPGSVVRTLIPHLILLDDRLPTPKDAPFAIGYVFEGKPHDYLPDVVGTLTNGKLFIAEAGMEDDKRQDRNLADARQARIKVQQLDDMMNVMRLQFQAERDGRYIPLHKILPSPSRKMGEGDEEDS